MGKLTRTLAALTLCLVFCSAPPSMGAVIRVQWCSPNNGPGNDWDHAYRTVTAGLNAAVSGDEVWVAGDAAHPYVERITLKLGVGLYGGLAGAETSRDQRDWRTNVTVLDGNQGGSVVISPPGATTDTVIDGFTIRNGFAPYGGGICCNGSSPAIRNNTIAANTASASGGGIMCRDESSPTISHNTIATNRSFRDGGGVSGGYRSVVSNNRIVANHALSGGGIKCGAETTISNNTISANGANLGGGIYCDGSAMISNNTITGNRAGSGGGIYISWYDDSPTVTNNIVAFNSSGLCVGHRPSTAVLANNCVYNAKGEDYDGIPVGATDIQVDPELVAVQYGQVHIQPDSPCRDAGDDGVVQAGCVDADGQARIQGTHVDIGADESDGTVWQFIPTVVRVSPTGDDSDDGSAWNTAKLTVQTALNAAGERGGEVWVAAGTYGERIVLPPYAFLYGGFGGAEISRDQRRPATNVTILDGGGTGSVVVARTGHSVTASGISGFTIRNGNAGSGGGIYCLGSPTISENVISTNRATYGAGICSGEYCSPTISSNTIAENTAATNGGGVYCQHSSPAIFSNIVARNTAAAKGGGVYCYESRAVISNNTIASNVSAAGGGIWCTGPSSSTAAILNNVVAFNSSGLYNEPYYTGSGIPVLKSNCVFNPSGYDYSELAVGATDIRCDPVFADRESANYHLGITSPCIDAGDNAAAVAGSLDIDCEPRILPAGRIVDIGADEYGAYAVWPAADAKRSAPDGDEVCFIRCAPVVVTAAFANQGIFYVETTDRSIGIQCRCATAAPSLGQSGSIHGVMQIVDGERLLTEAGIVPETLSTAAIPSPLLMTNSSLGGGPFGLQGGVWGWIRAEAGGTPQRTWQQIAGLNNIGLLVRTTGKVSAIDSASPPTWFKIDDGSGVDVKCLVPTGVVIDSNWTYVGVTGISSCEKVGDELRSLLRVRTQGDIVAY